MGINGADVTALRFREVMDLLRDMILLPTPSGRGRKEKGGRGTGAGTGRRRDDAGRDLQRNRVAAPWGRV